MIFKNLIKTKLCITETFSKTLLSLKKKGRKEFRIIFTKTFSDLAVNRNK